MSPRLYPPRYLRPEGDSRPGRHLVVGEGVLDEAAQRAQRRDRVGVTDVPEKMARRRFGHLGAVESLPGGAAEDGRRVANVREGVTATSQSDALLHARDRRNAKTAREQNAGTWRDEERRAILARHRLSCPSCTNPPVFRRVALIGMRQILAWVLVIVYFGGCAVLNQAVSDACTHGNCIHGWNSKYNGSEKALFFSWGIGFPLVIFGSRALVRQLTGEAVRDAEQRRAAAAVLAERAEARGRAAAERARLNDEAQMKREREASYTRASRGWQAHVPAIRAARQSAIARKAWSCQACGFRADAGVTYFYDGGYDRTKYCASCRQRSS